MTAIPGISITKDNRGKITHVSIDVRQHQEALPALEQLGLIQKDQFDIDFENGISLEQSRKNMMDFIDKLWQK